MLVSNQKINRKNTDPINVKGFLFATGSAVIVALIVVISIDPKLLPW